MKKKRIFENICLRMILEEQGKVKNLEGELARLQNIHEKLKGIKEILEKQNVEYKRLLTRALGRNYMLRDHFAKVSDHNEKVVITVAALKDDVNHRDNKIAKLEEELLDMKTKLGAGSRKI